MICVYCGLDDNDLHTDEDGEEVCLDCLYMYDRELYNDLTGEEGGEEDD